MKSCKTCRKSYTDVILCIGCTYHNKWESPPPKDGIHVSEQEVKEAASTLKKLSRISVRGTGEKAAIANLYIRYITDHIKYEV